MYEFYSILMIIASLLQIMLFFKVWSMTNDVKKMKNRFVPESSRAKILVEIHKKSPNLADVLFDSLYMELEQLYSNEKEENYYQTVKSYESLYKMADIPMPEIFLEIKTRADFYKHFRA